MRLLLTGYHTTAEAEGAGQSQGESSAFYENAQGRGDVREQLEARQPGSSKFCITVLSEEMVHSFWYVNSQRRQRWGARRNNSQNRGSWHHHPPR